MQYDQNSYPFNDEADDGQLAFFKPKDSAERPSQDAQNQGGYSSYRKPGLQLSNSVGRLNTRNKPSYQHNFAPHESLHVDELYIYDAQIGLVKSEMDTHISNLPIALEDILARIGEADVDGYESFLEELQELKLVCDKATVREKELYEILGRTENQGLRFKTIDVEQLQQLLDDTKKQLAQMPNLNVVQNDPLLSREYEQLDMKMSVLNKEILRRTVYDRANAIHYSIRPLRSVKSAIYYLNRFIHYIEPREYLIRAIKILNKLRQLAEFLKSPEDHHLSTQQVEQIQEVIRQGSYEWDREFLDKGSSVWDYGAFHMLKIPLQIPSIHEAGQNEEISLSVIPDYLVHQMRILLNDTGLRKKTAPTPAYGVNAGHRGGHNHSE
jgi:hypothetical protein